MINIAVIVTAPDTNDMKLCYIVICVFVLFVCGGCCNPGFKPIAKFKRNHPDEYSKYLYLYPISLDTYYYLEGTKYGAVHRVLLEVKKIEDAPKMNEYLQSKEKEVALEFQGANKQYKDLEILSEGGGCVCQFKWDDGRSDEIGLLVLKNGAIVKREVWVTEYFSESTGKSNSTW